MGYATRISVLVLHHDPVAREGLLAAFSKYSDLKVVHAADDPIDPECVQALAAQFRADVVVADYDCAMKLAGRTERRLASADAMKIMRGPHQS